MKKHLRLRLSRETLHTLERPSLGQAAAGVTETLPYTDPGSCWTCYFSCLYSACPGDTHCDCTPETN